MMESYSHYDLFTGILDKDGVPIKRGDTIDVEDSIKTVRGIVIWKNGSYVFQNPVKRDGMEYNIHAWRRNIKVVNSENRNRLFQHQDFKEEIEKYIRKNTSISITGEQCKELLAALKEGMKIKTERDYYNDLVDIINKEIK